VAGALLAFFCNVLRTAFLVWLGAKEGAAAIESWHDPAGLTILFVCLFGLWFLSLAMRRRSKAKQFSDSPQDKAAVADLPAGYLPASENYARAWPLVASIAIAVLLAGFGTQMWYGLHQSRFLSSRWSVRWPVSENDYRAVRVSPEAENLLRYNEGGGATWQSPEGHQWMLYSFRWFPGRTAALFVKIHRPDVCLPASGLQMQRDNGIQLLTINGINLPIRSYRFDDHGTPLHVFYCYWDARSSYQNTATAEEEDWTARGRLRAALRGRREIGAQMIELVVWGYEDDGVARAALEAQLRQLVQRAG
jgi:Transmembrane exosortase (Exosortase_EpsH)